MKRIVSVLLSMISFFTFFTVFASNNMFSGKELIINGTNVYSKEDLVFDSKFNREVTKDGYGDYDVYKDKNGNEYTYLSNTNKLCGLYFSGYSAKSYDENIGFSEQKIIKIAEDYLNLICDGNNQYTYDRTAYWDNLRFYRVQFVKKVNGLNTDDKAIFTIGSDGKVIGFVAYNRDRYNDVKIRTNSINVDRSVITEKINTDIFDINDEYLTKDIDNKLVWVCYVEYFNNDGYKVASQIVIPID